MITTKPFAYEPSEHEAEKASFSYLVSMVVLVVGLPVPLLYFLSTLFFYIAHRKDTYFVRWHSTQAVLTQATLLPVNTIGFWWTINIVFGDGEAGASYIAYLIVLFVFNLMEFIGTVYAAVQTRKGKHAFWWLYGDLTQLICKV